jgi:hypothetical protein
LHFDAEEPSQCTNRYSPQKEAGGNAMSRSIVLAATLAFAVTGSAFAADPADTTTQEKDKAATTEGAETSDRTPDKATPTPPAQTDTTKSGETSDRTPDKKGGTTEPPPN